MIQLKHLVHLKYCTLKEGDATWRLNIRGKRSDSAYSPRIRSEKKDDRLALRGKCRSGFGELKECHRSPH